MNTHVHGKRLVFVVLAATERRAQLVLLKKRATNTSLMAKTTVKSKN